MEADFGGVDGRFSEAGQLMSEAEAQQKGCGESAQLERLQTKMAAAVENAV